MRGKKRPLDERAKAVGIAMIQGVPAASDAMSIPQRTIRQWRDSAEFAELRLSARETVAEEMWVGIQIGFDQVVHGLLDPEERLRDKADALFGLMEQHALLTGGVTARTESRSLPDALDNATRQKLTDWIDSHGLDTDPGATDSVPAGAGAEVREPAAG